MDENSKIAYKGGGIRHLQCTLMFFGLTVAHALRVNLSVAIVAMTDKLSHSEHGVYEWDEKIKSIILSSFFWGYVVLQVPAGVIAQKYGAHKVLLCGVFVCSLLAVLTPICTQLGGWKLLCGLRLIQGLCQGCVTPSTHTLLSKWAPVKERGKLGTFCYSGSQFGTALMFTLSGEIAASFMGWPGIFYVSGGIGCVWGVFFYFFASSSPAESRFISDEEKKFIEKQPDAEKIKISGEEGNKLKMPTPWLEIFTSVPFYCLLIVQCSDSWAYSILFTQIPTYFKSILDMDIKKNALFSSLPYWVMLLLSYFFVFVAEVLRKTQFMSLPISRKFFNSIGMWVPMLGLLVLGYMGKEKETLVIGLLILIVGLKSACYLGFQMNHIDLSPNFAGTLMGMTNGTSHVFSVLAPVTVGFVVSDEKNLEQWRVVFFITAGFLFIGNLFFVLFGRFKTQHWNDPNYRNSKSSSCYSVCKNDI